MIDCPVCKSKLTLSRLHCGGCGLNIEGELRLPRLARLSAHDISLAEQMILCGGNLKDLATQIGVSYPTLRRRVDDMITALRTLKQDDDKLVASILEAIEKGTLKSEEGIRKIREVQGEI